MHAGPGSSGWILVPVQILVMSAGVLGGMLWAGIVALLRDRFNTNEILVSLMLVYVATLLLNYLVYGPWKDPNGCQLPADRAVRCQHAPAAPDPGLRMNLGLVIALVLVALCWSSSSAPTAAMR